MAFLLIGFLITSVAVSIAIISSSRSNTLKKLVDEETSDLRRSYDQLTKLSKQVPGSTYQFRLFPDGHSCFPYAIEGINDVYEVSPEDVHEDASLVFSRLHPEDYDAVVDSIQKSANTMQLWHLEYRVILPKQGLQWLQGKAKPELLEDGSILWHGFITKITEHKHAEEEMKQSESRWKFAIEGAGDGLWDWDVVNGTVFFSESWKALLGYTKNELSNGLEEWEKRVHPDDKVKTLAALQSHLDGKISTYLSEYRILCKNGIYIWVLDRGRIVSRDDNHKPLHLIGILQNITDRMLTENILRIAATTFESHEGMLVTDAQTKILRVNAAFTSITGYSAEEVIGQTPRVLNSGRHDNSFYESMWKSLAEKGSWEGEIWNRCKGGDIYPENLNITAVRDAQGVVTNYVAMLTDISSSKNASEEIRNLAFYDPLTHLPNRGLLIDRLKQALVVSARSGRCGAILFLDLDQFKSLNDTAGHDVGDLLLKEVAARLTNCIRESDTVARLGGDEFVVIIEDLSPKQIEAATQTEVIGQKILHSLSQPYQLGTYNHLCTASIGATLFNQHDRDVEEIIKKADIAMYQVKSGGRNALRFFDPQMQEVITSRVDMEQELRQALLHKQFELHYQIQVDSTGSPLGAEALIRWNHPRHETISPLRFIQLAEQTGLILPIGQWVLETACAQLILWQQNPASQHLALSINVSAKQFHQTKFVAETQETVQRYGIDPTKLKLELTESMLVDDFPAIVAKMNTLSALGIRFSLDDFGTGYSSLQYLKKLPLSQLKIDQSFVRDITIDPSDYAITRTIIAMARSLDLGVIAEGVETEEQMQCLLEIDCTQFQGYLFGKPMPIEAFDALLK